MSKVSKIVKEPRLNNFLDILFPMSKKIDFNVESDTLFIETNDFSTEVAVVDLGESNYVAKVFIPSTYSLPSTFMSSYTSNFDYYFKLFNINTILFSLDKVVSIMFDYNSKSKRETVKLLMNTSMGVNAVLSLSNSKSNITINGVTINLAIEGSPSEHYNSIFHRFFINKKNQELCIQGIPVWRIKDFFEEASIAPCDFVSDYIEVLKMYDY
jgi:hypothetical protein